MSVRTRFAPSPTGQMHIGGVRTALFAWLFARKHGGQFILRIEDTDKAREVEGSIAHIIESLRWLGIEWDEGVDIGGPFAPYLQSQRVDSYVKYAQQLIDAGFAYPDPYTEEEVEVFRQRAVEEKRPFLYRDHRPDTFGTWDGTRSLRFRVPEIKRYTWTDLVRGELSAGEEALDDFILMKADGLPTYNFAHVIDDLEMKITHIMRGEEFISSTPKFLSLYEALGIQRPEIATMPVILGNEGTKKLGKRDGAKDILEYREEGILPEAMMNFLALLGWHPQGNEELMTPAELIQAFEVTNLQKGGARLDEDKLHFINQHWMRALSDADYITRGHLETTNADVLLRAVPLLKERAQTFGEARAMLLNELDFLSNSPVLNPVLLTSKRTETLSTKDALALSLEALKTMPELQSVDDIRARLMPIADVEEEKGKGGRGGVLWPLRYALSGKERSPDPFTLISVLGSTEARSRVELALGIL